MKTVFFAAVAVFAVSCTNTSSQSVRGPANTGIVNGHEASASDVTSFAEPVVGIYTGDAICSGTLIDPQVVLTAGHCFEGVKSPSDLIVFLHVLNMLVKPRPANALLMKVDAYFVHPNYPSKSSLDDVALIHLSQPVPAGTKIATLPQETFDFAKLTEVMALGYGTSNDAHNASFEESGAGTLRYTTFQADHIDFIANDKTMPEDLRGMLAAAADTTAVCSGDSGGPLMLSEKGASQNVVLGINDAVLPNYTGEEGDDFKKAAANGDMAGYYTKYPAAHDCLGGLNFFVPVTTRLSFIITAKTALLNGTTPPQKYIPDPDAPAENPGASPTPTPTPTPKPVPPLEPAPTPIPAK